MCCVLLTLAFVANRPKVLCLQPSLNLIRVAGKSSCCLGLFSICYQLLKSSWNQQLILFDSFMSCFSTCLSMPHHEFAVECRMSMLLSTGQDSGSAQPWRSHGVHEKKRWNSWNWNCESVSKCPQVPDFASFKVMINDDALRKSQSRTGRQNQPRPLRLAWQMQICNWVQLLYAIYAICRCTECTVLFCIVENAKSALFKYGWSLLLECSMKLSWQTPETGDTLQSVIAWMTVADLGEDRACYDQLQ